DQIPEIVSDELGGKSAQQVIAESNFPSFSSYGLRGSENRSDLVEGTLYEIGMYDALALAHFDIAGPQLGDAAWRYWYHGIELSDGRKVMTLNIGNDQPVDRVVSGEGYNPFLNGKEATLSVVQSAMDQYWEGFDQES
ncbi:MAG TPA: hypothetical protein P5247_02315, partial [Candidatus Saccharimonadales bacterium]|nr:hypothetical protein [Candidatus Saccharimonadales bacterium]